MTGTIVEIPRLNLETAEVTLVGDSPLIMHKWSEKAIAQIRDKQQKRASKAREAKDPDAECRAATYFLSETDAAKHGTPYGFPSVAFKAAGVSACRSLADMKMTQARALFHIDGELSPIYGAPEMREDPVKVGMGGTDLRYRPMFDPWAVKLHVTFNAGVLSLEMLLSLFHVAGFSTGVGEWRPEKNGQMGRFRIATEDDLKRMSL